MGSLLEFMRSLKIGEKMEVRQTKFGICICLRISPNNIEYLFDTVETAEESYIVPMLERGIDKLRKQANA